VINGKNKGKMKQIHRFVNTGLLLLTVAMAGCSGDGTEMPATDADNRWEVAVSRNVTGGEYVTVALRYGGTVSSATLVPADTEGGTATWLNELKPQWPADEQTSVEAIAFCPVVDELPATVSAADGKAWLMDYKTCTSGSKPASFTLEHLMAQLEVHIQLHDDAEHHHRPEDAVVRLVPTATVNYAGKKLEADAVPGDFVLTAFDRENESYGSDENWVNTAQVVIPQTLAKGQPCLTFRAGDKTYTFVPENDIELQAGQKTKLYLGVAYENATVALEGITISPWNTGVTIEGTVNNPDNNS